MGKCLASQSHVATRKLGMHSEVHGNVVHPRVELLLLVSMLFLLTILLILKEFLYTSLYSFCKSKGLWLHQIDTSAD